MSDYLRRWPAPKTLVNKGDAIEGTLISWDAYSEKYPVAHIQTADGLVRIFRFAQTRLRELIADANPQIGDVIFIRYDGEAEKAAPGMNKTKLFTVEVRRKGSAPQTKDSQGTSGDNPAMDGRSGGRK